jgi:hypothetical protein
MAGFCRPRRAMSPFEEMDRLFSHKVEVEKG